jgi:hypothetical protein
VQVTFVVIDHEIPSVVIRTLPLLWASGMYRSYQFLGKGKAACTGKLFDSLIRNDEVLNCALVNSMWLTDLVRRVNYLCHHISFFAVKFFGQTSGYLIFTGTKFQKIQIYHYEKCIYFGPRL